MKQSSLFKRFAATLLTLVCLHSGASASTVFWGSEFNDLLFDSNAQSLGTSYSFEIGTFGSFIPTSSNADQWASNWKVFDRAFNPDANGWNAVDQFFVGTVEHNALGGSDSPDANPADVFTQGERIYLWAYNSKSLVPGSEWALVTDTVLAGNTASQWVIPDPLDPPGTSYELKLVDADTIVFGGLKNVQGAGTFSATPGSFNLQTATVVPEPGSAFLLFAAAVAFVGRRNSRRLTRSTLA